LIFSPKVLIYQTILYGEKLNKSGLFFLPTMIYQNNMKKFFNLRQQGEDGAKG
jgi:hypothetical protein